ncbi:MAG: DUF1292 domain-containing protein [Oscillospiraceae bacterium]
MISNDELRAAVPLEEIEILANFSIEERNYIATIEKTYNEPDKIFLFKYENCGNEDEIELIEIEDDKEFEDAVSAFKALCIEGDESKNE